MSQDLSTSHLKILVLSPWPVQSEVEGRQLGCCRWWALPMDEAVVGILYSQNITD